jgi:hypothetical protein
MASASIRRAPSRTIWSINDVGAAAAAVVWSSPSLGSSETR